ENCRHDGEQRYRREIAVDVIGQLVVDVRVYGERADVADDQRVAVGLGVRRLLHGDVAATAALVLDHDLLAEALGHLLGGEPRHDRRAAAGGEGNEQADGFGRVSLRVRDSREEGNCQNQRPHLYKPCFSSHAWMWAATSRLLRSIISMCELPRKPACGRSTTSTLPPALVIASPNATPLRRIAGQRESCSMKSP